MPGAPAPFVDTWAPAQFAAAADSTGVQFSFGQAGAPGPARTTFANSGAQVAMNTDQNTNFDTTLHFKLAGTIVLALVAVFVLHQLGFRFVVAAGVGGK